MKTRSGFVSNSSSSSFVINKRYISEYQIEALTDPTIYFDDIVAQKYYDASDQDESFDYYKQRISEEYQIYNYRDDPWSVSMNGENIKFYTSMDNFNLCGFAKWIGVPREHMIYGE